MELLTNSVLYISLCKDSLLRNLNYDLIADCFRIYKKVFTLEAFGLTIQINKIVIKSRTIHITFI